MSSQKNNFSFSKFQLSVFLKASPNPLVLTLVSITALPNLFHRPTAQEHYFYDSILSPFTGPTDFSAMAINTNLSTLQVFQNRNNSLIARSPLKRGILRRIKLSSPCCSMERPSYSRNITFYTEGSLTF